MPNSFETVYERLTPALADLEIRRKQGRGKMLKTSLITAAVLLSIGVLTLKAMQGYPAVIELGIVISIIVAVVSSKLQSRRLAQYYKQEVMPQLVDAILPGAEYRPADGISEATFRSCQLFRTMPDRYRSEDLITGTSDKTVFQFSEVHAEERHVSTTSKGRRRETWTDIFRGFLFMADFNKHFAGNTVIARDAWIKSGSWFSGKMRIKMASNAFEKRFDVYSTDDVEARYILTPALQERLLAIDERMGRKMTVGFHDSYIYLALPTKANHFEANIWHKLTREDVEQAFQTIASFIQLIDELNLNTRIWTKE
jgi:hypothetical protein